MIMEVSSTEIVKLNLT